MTNIARWEHKENNQDHADGGCAGTSGSVWEFRGLKGRGFAAVSLWPVHWRDWVAPGTIVAILTIIVSIATAIITWHLNAIDKRFGAFDTQYGDISQRLTNLDAKIDRRIDSLGDSIKNLNGRIDSVLQQQSAMAMQVAQSTSDIANMKPKVDRIAEKLQVGNLREDNGGALVASDGVTLTDEQRAYIRRNVESGRYRPPAGKQIGVGSYLPSEVATVKPPKRWGDDFDDLVFALSSDGRILVVRRDTRRVVGMY